MNKSIKTTLFAAFAALALAASLYVCGRTLSSAKDPSGKAVSESVQVPSGISVKELGARLKEGGFIRSSRMFYIGARFPLAGKIFTGSKKPLSLKSGVYRISSSMKLSQIYEVLSSGKQEYIRVSIPEGLTKSKIARRLEDAGVCAAEDFVKAATDPFLAAALGIKSESLEGYLFPDTYFLAPGMDAEKVARMMVENFFSHAGEIPVLKDASGEDLDRIVRLASIVEREYRIPEEAPLIASVFKNRMRHNWGLYSCATVEYIITEIEGRPHPDVITYADLSMDSPYNTYRWAGLPPTAISNPGTVALSATANAPDTGYFYFRLVDGASGRHVFTKDFSQHISEGYSQSTKRSGN